MARCFCCVTLCNSDSTAVIDLDKVVAAGVVDSKFDSLFRHYSDEIHLQTSIQPFKTIAGDYFPCAIDWARIQPLRLANLLDEARLDHVNGKDTAKNECNCCAVDELATTG
jgi:hypothetical protein